MVFEAESSLPASHTLVEQDPVFLGKDALVVQQREFATVGADDGIPHICTTAATTCCIVAMKTSLHTVSLAHLDGRDTHGILRRMVESMPEAEGDIDVILAGSYDDEQGHSASNLSEVAEFFSNWCPKPYHIVAAAVGTINTKRGKEANLPRVTSLGVSIETGQFFPVELEHEPPLLLVRAHKQRSITRAQVRHCRWMGQGSAPNIFDRQSRQLWYLLGVVCIERMRSIEPFQFSMNPRDANFLMSLPDRQLLQTCSTSPFAEAPDFCETMRRTLVMVTEKPSYKSHWPHGAARFRLDSGEWRPV